MRVVNKSLLIAVKKRLLPRSFFLFSMDDGQHISMGLSGKKIIFRADGGPKRGIGHLMRCLALADGAADLGGQVWLASRDVPEMVRGLFQARGYQVFGAERGIEALAADWLVVDNYDIDAAERQQLAGAASKLAIIDDAGDNGPYEADLLINPNPFASQNLYAPANSAAIGAPHVLLRREILEAKQPRHFGDAQKILVSCGGSDPAKAAIDVLALLERLRDVPLHIRMLLGPLGTDLQYTAHSTHTITIVRGARDMEMHLNWADIAILAAGTTQWEAAYLGCPFIALIIADNQLNGARGFAEAGGSMAIDWRAERHPGTFLKAFQSLQRDAKAREVMSRCAQSLIDGQGAARIAGRMAQMV